MTADEIQTKLIPLIETFAGVPLIEADTAGDRPEGPHVTFKFTMPYGKDAGGPNVSIVAAGGAYNKRLSEEYRLTVSFTAVSSGMEQSRALAQSVRDWFAFAGEDAIQDNGVAVVSLGDVANRDAFVVDEYERRNGFDAFLRANRELVRTVDIIETAEISRK